MKKFKIVKSKKGDFILKQKTFLLFYKSIGRFTTYSDCNEFIEKKLLKHEIKYNVREW